MNIKLRLTVMNFLQFFIWGSWLLTIGAFWFQTKKWTGTDFGAIFSTMGIASLFMPAIAGILADKWINAERLYAIFHFAGGLLLLTLPAIGDPHLFFWVMLLTMMFYMPTIGLSITIAYNSLKMNQYSIVQSYPPIRVWGTVGFIVALWVVSLAGLEKSAGQFYIAAGASFVLGAYAFTLPRCLPMGKGHKPDLVSALGLNAFALFKNRKMASFFLFAMLLGAALQLTNAYGDTFLHDFAKVPEFKDLIAVKYPAIIMSISQISETLFILTIPFFLRKYGIKNVMLLSMVAWVLRFGLFAYGDPAGGLWMIILSCIIYGMAFDFFNISGSIFVETQSIPAIRASAQGLFMMMTNGFGALLGSRVSGIVIDRYFTDGEHFMWKEIWIAFALYSLVVAILFVFLFRHKHNPAEVENVHH
ncbi:MAG: nucleoside permease [Prolixibacteraceae bacterium]|jgi:NHS family xanthosine MFS transporter|nr:nucleoside permease [Prolixibacteraceae bacterium]NLX28347.1 nucleoside permease [Bacteroidales bacterium]HPJ79664.1 nucleoside permease [Prolixibacteraceae bacterium]HRV87752.1 nucleoside permease [Prolixibacteraceae bacterium]